MLNFLTAAVTDFYFLYCLFRCLTTATKAGKYHHPLVCTWKSGWIFDLFVSLDVFLFFFSVEKVPYNIYIYFATV